MGYIGYMPSKNVILIAMRGTEDIKNWLEDFSFKMINYFLNQVRRLLH